MRCLLEYVTLVDGYVDILKLKRIGGIYKHFPHGKIRPNRTNEPLMCRMDYPNIGYSHGNPMICHGLPYLNGQRFGYNPFCANHLISLVILQIRIDYVRLDQVRSGTKWSYTSTVPVTCWGADMSHDTSTGHALQALAMWGQDKAFGSSQKDRLHYIYIADSQNPYYIIEISIANYM